MIPLIKSPLTPQSFDFFLLTIHRAWEIIHGEADFIETREFVRSIQRHQFSVNEGSQTVGPNLIVAVDKAAVDPAGRFV